jgi:3-oxoacyl-[acyl-carrier protein] reductase
MQRSCLDYSQHEIPQRMDTTMIDPGLKKKVVLVTGGNNPHGIGAAIARQFASHGAHVFIHGYRQEIDLPSGSQKQKPGLPFFFEQQRKDANEVVESIRKAGGKSEHWDGDLRDSRNVALLFEKAEKAFGHVDILVNNAAEYTADTFLPPEVLDADDVLWEGGPAISTVNSESYERHFQVNSRAVAILMAIFARRIIQRKVHWGRVINISADCAWGSPKEVSYRASKYAVESYSRSAAAELGPYGITVNVVSPGPVQSGYISPELEKVLIPDIPLRRIGLPEDIAHAVVFFASEQAGWITGQVLFVHGGHRMALGQS